jgi:hypothetical protein
MGYTHYLERKEKLPTAKWKPFIEDAKKILDTADCPLTHVEQVGHSWEDAKGYRADSKVLHFNGAGEDSHETMHISRVYESESWERGQDEPMKFTFCKTAYKPYDKYVTAIALLASLHFGNDVKNSSDGDQSDWEAGKKVLENALGIKTKWSDDFAVKLVVQREENKETPNYTKG